LVTSEQRSSAWLADVKDRARSRVQAEAVAEGTQFSSGQLELTQIGLVAGVSAMLEAALDLDTRGGAVSA
jgi:hypothetical protein